MMSQNTSPQSTVNGWYDLSEHLPETEGWMHSGVAVTSSSEMLVAHPEGHALLCISRDGAVRTVPVPLTELHSISLTSLPDVIAVADPGHRFIPARRGAAYGDETNPGRAVLLDATDGSVLLEFFAPDHPAYADQGWRPTSIAVDDGAGGSGDIWIADGYSKNLVHKYNSSGSHMLTIGADRNGLTFDCPHGIALRRIDGRLELFIADRSNRRIVVVDGDGKVMNIFGNESIDSPSSLVFAGKDLYVTELNGGIARFASDGTFVTTLEHVRPRSPSEPGWPNQIDKDGNTVAPQLRPSVLNSPHGIAFHDGHLYLTEWLIGGRISRIPIN